MDAALIPQPFGEVTVPDPSSHDQTAHFRTLPIDEVLAAWNIIAYPVSERGESLEQGTTVLSR
jgi:hypothetical protein